MIWQAVLTALLALDSLKISSAHLTESFAENYLSHDGLDESNLIENDALDANNVDKEWLDTAMRLLTKLLIVPWPEGVSPLLYVDNNSDDSITSNVKDEIPNGIDSANYYSRNPVKRMKVYRKYPWKRQNSRYEPGNPYICNPSKVEVTRLLVALHDARQGNRERFVDFCNRKRPAFSVFTNIRYVGK